MEVLVLDIELLNTEGAVFKSQHLGRGGQGDAECAQAYVNDVPGIVVLLDEVVLWRHVFYRSGGRTRCRLLG